mmetsp:Transcript_66277/g.138423  ORF Transcript_66277/g.138423 Transcript_66277/m.138423 type:complete len:233 (-) Transcript_66277:722-1420(-)
MFFQPALHQLGLSGNLPFPQGPKIGSDAAAAAAAVSQHRTAARAQLRQSPPPRSPLSVRGSPSPLLHPQFALALLAKPRALVVCRDLVLDCQGFEAVVDRGRQSGELALQQGSRSSLHVVCPAAVPRRYSALLPGCRSCGGRDCRRCHTPPPRRWRPQEHDEQRGIFRSDQPDHQSSLVPSRENHGSGFLVEEGRVLGSALVAGSPESAGEFAAGCSSVAVLSVSLNAGPPP